MCWIVSKIIPNPLHTMCAGGVSMCRQNQALGMAVIAFCAGLLLGGWCEAGLGIFFVGIGGICLGMGLLKKK